LISASIAPNGSGGAAVRFGAELDPPGPSAVGGYLIGAVEQRAHRVATDLAAGDRNVVGRSRKLPRALNAPELDPRHAPRLSSRQACSLEIFGGLIQMGRHFLA